MAKKQAPDKRPEIYVSTDVEADGPIPGPHSMLSFASVAMLADKTVIGTFSANLETLPGAAGHPVQMQWWKTQPDAWAACRRDLERPEDVLPLADLNPAMSVKRLYENYTEPSYRPGALPESRATVLPELNAGYGLAMHVGHGYRNSMSVGDVSLNNAELMPGTARRCRTGR